MPIGIIFKNQPIWWIWPFTNKTTDLNLEIIALTFRPRRKADPRRLSRRVLYKRPAGGSDGHDGHEGRHVAALHALHALSRRALDQGSSGQQQPEGISLSEVLFSSSSSSSRICKQYAVVGVSLWKNVG